MRLYSRRKLVILVGSVSLIAYLGVVWMGLHRPTVRGQAHLVQTGMTTEEVKAIWGKPDCVRDHPDVKGISEDYWYTWDGLMIVCFINGQVAEVQGIPHEPLTWLWSRCQMKLGIR